MDRSARELRERLEPWVDRSGDHWLWRGSLATKGYGRLRLDGVKVLAHRASYEAYVGPIPEGLTIDHLCRVRACVKPAHLEAVTMRENVLRGIGPAAIHARQTHCKRGHLLAGEHVYQSPEGHRRCRTCQLEAHAERYRTDKEYRMHKIMVSRAWRVARAHLQRSEAAQTLVEYGLLLALIAVVAIVALLFLGPVIADMFEAIGNQLNPAGGSPAP
jgi:Flp pilus assembly pilin Flp